MTEAPMRIWIPHRDVESLVDVSDGSIVKGPGPYYVRADIADEMLAAAKMLGDAARDDCPPQEQIDRETEAWVALDAAIAKAEPDGA